MSLDLIDVLLGLLSLAPAIYAGFAAAVLVYRHAWALRRAQPVLAYLCQANVGLWAAGVVTLGVMLLRLRLGWVPAGAEGAERFTPFMACFALGLFAMTVLTALAEWWLRRDVGGADRP